MIDRDNYNKIFDNGVVHINSAKILAADNSFGLAISHIILGIEELIKYHVVMNNNVDESLFDTETSSNGRKTVFRDHLLKHDLLKEFQESMSKEFSEKFMECMFQKLRGLPLTPEHLEIEKNRFKATGNFLSNSYSEVNIPENECPAFFEWLNNANNLKNQGFYVSSTYDSPNNITKDEYETALKYGEALLKQTEILKSMDLTDDEFIDMLNTEAEIDEAIVEKMMDVGNDSNRMDI